MPATRSSTRSITCTPTAKAQSQPVIETPKPKRKATTEKEPGSTTAKKPRVTKTPSKVAAAAAQLEAAANWKAPEGASNTADAVVPAELTFSFEDAKKYLISADPRFEDIFAKLICKPFENLEQVHPFRSLTTSILGQQISWMAARSIIHKFKRLYDPSLPEKATDYDSKDLDSFFPTPLQVATTDITTLRTAGLSVRKAEYVQDLSRRFADGRLSTEKLLEANDDELAEMLIEVRGIGRWTVDMFAMFTLRRPDILPVGDLGVQRGMLRWFLSQHSSTYKYSLSPEKVDNPSSVQKKEKKEESSTGDFSDDEDDDVLPVPSTQEGEDGTLADASSALHAAAPQEEDDSQAMLPPTFTPSIRKTLNQSGFDNAFVPPPLPAGLTPAILKSRLDTKKKIKGALLTPKEMEELTESWKPYRTIGVYFMWALADADVA